MDGEERGIGARLGSTHIVRRWDTPARGAHGPPVLGLGNALQPALVMSVHLQLLSLHRQRERFDCRRVQAHHRPAPEAVIRSG